MVQKLLRNLAILPFLMLGQFASAQGLFDPVVKVNDAVVTTYELRQRIQFMKVTRRVGNLQRQALDDLIDDRLKQQAARQLGIEPNPEELEAAIVSLAQRANLNPQQFLRAMANDGVATATIRDFLATQLVWREVIGARFGRQGVVSEQEIDRAINSSGSRSSMRVLLAEIILPARPHEKEDALRLAERITQFETFGAFGAAAAEYSVAPSKERRGLLEWTNVSDLPPPLQPVVMALKPGQVTAPFEVPNAVILFQLRGLAENALRKPRVTAVEYAKLPLASDQVPAFLDRVDVCDDFYGQAGAFTQTPVEIIAQQPGDVPREIGLAIASLDANETATLPLRADGQVMVIMLCGRTHALNDDPDRDAIARSLRERRLSSLADGYLAELKSAATITRP